MKKFLIIIVAAVVLSAMAQQVVIKYIIDYPLRPIPGDNDAWLLEDANEPAGVHQYIHTTTKGIMSYASLHQNLLFPNGTGVFTNDGAGNVGFTLSLRLTEVDAQNFFPTNLFTGITNAPLLSTDGNGKIKNGTPLAATNVTYIAGANLTFTTNADGSIVIASSATITVTTVTNNTFVNTNTFISTSNSFFNITYITNLYSDTITNNTFVNTNVVILSGKANVNTLIITNTTFVNNPTNLAATASTVAYWGADKTLGNVANAVGALTNDGSGAVGYYNSFASQPGNNVFTGTSNYFGTQLAVGMLTRMASLSVTNAITNGAATASTLASYDAGKKLVSVANAYGVLTNDGSGVVGYGWDMALATNLTYKYTTNIVGAANFVFGKAYWTNITGNFTFPALTMQDAAAMETLAVWVTNSGASTFTATINGVAGAPGHVVPAVFYCTNATVTEIDVSHFGVLWTNAISKN